jgi:hypothetical protein
VKLACGRVGYDVDGTAVQPGRPALRLLSGPASCMGRQLVYLHGAGNHFPTCRGGGVCAPSSRRVSCPTPQSESGGSSRGAETCRARWRLVGGDPSCRELIGDATNWSGA